MKKSELKRYTPLSSSAPLQRSKLQANQGGHHKPAAGPKRKPGYRGAVPAGVLAVLKARAENLCEIMLPDCGGTPTDPAHRIKQGIGGRHGAAKVAHDVPSNALYLCRFCHAHCHAQPNLAYRRGWMLKEWQRPLTERVLYRGAWRWLDDQGAVLTTPPPVTSEEA